MRDAVKIILTVLAVAAVTVLAVLLAKPSQISPAAESSRSEATQPGDEATEPLNDND